jgi:hypothetical protein
LVAAALYRLKRVVKRLDWQTPDDVYLLAAFIKISVVHKLVHAMAQIT